MINLPETYDELQRAMVSEVSYKSLGSPILLEEIIFSQEKMLNLQIGKHV